MASRATASGASASRREALRRGGAAAAIIGGTAWFVKAAVIIATGDEPPVAFTIGFSLFPFALLGLWSLVRNVEGRTPRLGGAIAVAAAISVVVALLVRAVGGASVEPAEDEVTVLTPFIVIAGFGTFAALVALGIAVRRAGALAAPYTSLPWAMGLAAIPLLIVGGALETVSERLFELPIALFGLAWIALGAALWRDTLRVPRQPFGCVTREAPTPLRDVGRSGRLVAAARVLMPRLVAAEHVDHDRCRPARGSFRARRRR